MALTLPVGGRGEDEARRLATPAAVAGFSIGRMTTCGTVTAAATITAADPGA